MAFQKLYTCPFKSLDQKSYRVEIWKDTTDAVTPVEVTGGASPFVVNYPTIEDKFAPVRGSGCDISLISENDRQFIGLYTAKMQEYQIRFFKDNALVWCGFLDTELYREPFNINKNYEVTLSGSDGFAILNRIAYVTPSNIQLSGDGLAMVEMGKKPYSGIVSQWEVIKTVLGKLGLPWNSIFVSISTTSPDLVIGPTENIFEKTFCINENWYNEDSNNNAETCRTVLEEILRPYGAFIIQDNANLIITDVNTLAGGVMAPAKYYSGSTFAYIGNSTLVINAGDIGDIGFMDSANDLNIVPAINKQVVKYSAYKKVKVIDYSAVADFSQPGAPSAPIGDTNYQWTETPMGKSYAWNKSGNGRFINLNGVLPQKDTDSYLSIPSYGDGAIPASAGVDPLKKSFVYLMPLPYMIPDAGYRLRVKMTAMFRMSDNINKPDEIPSVLAQGVLRCRLKIGSMEAYNYRKYPMGVGQTVLQGWRPIGQNIASGDSFPSAFYLYLNDLKGVDASGTVNYVYSSIENQWIDLNGNVSDFLKNGVRIIRNDVVQQDFTFPLSGFSGDILQFEIYDWDVLPHFTTDSQDALKAQVKELRIKALTFSIVDKDGKELTPADTEYVATLDASYKNSGKDITVLQGTGFSGCPIEKAAMLGLKDGAYFHLQQWTRQGVTDRIENLLLRSIVGNYADKTIELSPTLHVLPFVSGVLTYADYLPGKKMMVMGSTIDFEQGSCSLTLQEVATDSLTINRNY